MIGELNRKRRDRFPIPYSSSRFSSSIKFVQDGFCSITGRPGKLFSSKLFAWSVFTSPWRWPMSLGSITSLVFWLFCPLSRLQVLEEETSFVRILTLNRPRQLNALSAQMVFNFYHSFYLFNEKPYPIYSY